MSSAPTRRHILLGTAAVSLSVGGLLMPDNAFACHDYKGPSGTGCAAYKKDQASGGSSTPASSPSSPTTSSPQTSSPQSSGDPKVSGGTIRVSNGSQLQSALGSASAGNRIELANGTYSGKFTITKSGTKASPILIESSSRLQAELRSQLSIQGDHVIVSGLSFRGVGIELRAANCRVTRCYFNGGGTLISARGAANAEIDRNELTRWSSRGIHFDPEEDRRTGLKPHIYRNYFHSSMGDNRNNGVIIGDNGAHHKINVGALVEYNLFENMQNAKTFSTKSSGNMIRYNTMINCQGITNRWGVANRYIGNWLERCDAFRITDLKVVVEGNKLVNCKYGMLVLAGDERSSDQRRGGYPASDSCQLIDNDAGQITVGTTYSGFKFPAVNTELRGNRGSVKRASETNTRITSTDQGRAGKLAVKLGPSQVGPRS